MNTPETNSPILDTATISIDILTSDPEGLIVTTRQSLARTALTNPHLTEPQTDRLRHAVRSEAKFLGVDTYEEVRSRYGADSDEAKAAWKEYRAKAAAGNKAGIRSIEYDANTNTVSVDAINVPFPVYKELSKPDSSPELLEFAMATGNAAVIITADDKLIVQHRAVQKHHMTSPGIIRGNALYPDIPGVSAAGMFDAPKGNQPGKPGSVTNETILDSIKREIDEELGLGDDDISKLKVVGITTDKIQPHSEFMLLGQTNLTADEVYAKSSTTNRNRKLGDADFEEKFMTIEATPAAIMTLLTEVRSPLPSTHAATVFAAGYAMVLEQSGQVAADTWRTDMQEKMNRNEEIIDQTIRDYYQNYPKALTQIPERYWGKQVPARNPHGYSPTYTPEEQGLPSLENELVRTGLKPETRTVVSRVHLFDIDGTLSELDERRVVHDELFDELVKRLELGEPIALNTGRSTEWAIQTVIEPLKTRLKNPALLHLMSIVGEKGNTWATFTTDGELYQGQADSVSIPESLRNSVVNLVHNDPEFASMISLDADPHKTTMLSPVMTPLSEGVSSEQYHEKFRHIQTRFSAEVNKLIQEHGLANLFEIDNTAIASDIQSVYTGKDLGADRFLAIIEALNINASHASFIAYGDSESDLAMADELEQRGLNGEFVYVGGGVLTPATGYHYTVVNKESENSSGTLGFLQTLQ